MYNWKEKWKQWMFPVILLAFLLSGGIWYTREYTTVGNSVNGHEMPVCSVETQKKQMSLTFETAWKNEWTEEILDILKEEKVKASFFVTVDWMNRNPDLIRRMEKEGHDVGTLGVSHENLSLKSGEAQIEELVRAKEEAKQQGTLLELFRPPYGRYDDDLIRNAEKEGLFTICWSIDPMDWKGYGSESIIQKVLEDREFGNGAIIRLNSESEDTAVALKNLIQEIEKKDYQLVPVSGLIYREGYHMDVKGRQIPGMT